MPWIASLRGSLRALDCVSERVSACLDRCMQVRAILNLSQQIENQNAIVECGTIPELVQLTKTGSQKAMEIAAAGLSELASGAIAERERHKAMALGIDVDSLKRLGSVGFSESSGVTPSMSHTARSVCCVDGEHHGRGAQGGALTQIGSRRLRV